MARVFACVATAIALAACGESDVREQAGSAVANNAPAEELDPFVVMIGAERWTVLLDRAREGAIQANEPAGAAEMTDMFRADMALKQGAAMVIELRNRVCAKGLVTGEACRLPDWPAWTRDQPTGDTPITEIDRRSAWLETVMAPFVEAGCQAGRQASGDDLFCSVE